MRVRGLLLILSLLLGSFAPVVRAQQERPWWAGVELGDGQLQLRSDQASQPRTSTMALGFAGGHTLGEHLRAGVEVNGWLLQAFDLNNPAVGESVSNVWGIVDAFPAGKIPFFVRGGAGYSSYTINRPEGIGSSGWSWTAGAGYEFRVREILGLAPMVAYSAGDLGSVPAFIPPVTNRRYSVIEFKVALNFHFGRPKQKRFR